MKCDAINCSNWRLTYMMYFPMVVGKPQIVLCKDHFQELKLETWSPYCKDPSEAPGFRESQAELAISDIKSLYSMVSNLDSTMNRIERSLDTTKSRVDLLEDRDKKRRGLFR